MASSQSRFNDSNYLNWLSGTLCLQYVKEGIEDIVDTEAVQFHNSLLHNLPGTKLQPCFKCTSQCMKKDVRRKVWYMPCTLCDPWLKEIVKNHTVSPLPNLRTENTDPQRWRTVPYEVFKAYMPYGCQRNQSAKDGDAQSIFNLIQNCCHFNVCGRIRQIHLIDELLEFRNFLFHSGNFLVDDAALQAAQQTMLDFLRGMTSLSTPEQQSVDQSVSKIQKLQTGLLDLSLNKELELRALQLKQNALDADLNSLEHKLATTSKKSITIEVAVHTIQADLTASNAERAKIETDIKAQTEKLTGVEENLQKLQAVQDSFNMFIQANNLELDMARLSTTLENDDQRIQSLETQTQNLDVVTKKQEGEIATLYQRQQSTNTMLQERQRESHAHKSQLQAHTTMLESHQGRLEHVETELQEKQTKSQAHKRQLQAHTTMLESHQDRLEHVEARLHNQTASEASDMTAEAIAALRVSLIKHYRDNSLHVKIPVVCQELAIEDIYVVPKINVLRETDKARGVLSKGYSSWMSGYTSVCGNLFFTKAYNNKQIYITADAGMGKTMFCKYLVNLWCEAHSESRSDSPTKSNSSDENLQGQKAQAIEKDKKCMSCFKLLFYITLRDSAKQYKLNEMIDSQILQSSRKTKSLKALDVLQTEGCLVIIDGLDEWVCPEGIEVPHYVNPGIPGKLDLNSNTVFLTTTRPWKYDVLNLSNKDVDKYAELVGFDNQSADDLCFNLFKLMNKAESVKKDVQTFDADIRKIGLSHLCNIPVILTVLVCLWFDKQDLGKSPEQLYCSMLEMLLKRADKNFPHQTCASTMEASRKEMRLPKCFLNYKHCHDHHVLLFSLCKVAFEALFDQKREQALVFESSQMEILGVDQINVDLCLKSGILSQSRVLGQWSVSEKKLSFLHKSLQEFLAAVFILCENKESIVARVKQFCTSVESILEMSQMWIFLSSLNYDVAKQLLVDLMTGVVLKDTSLHQYRQTIKRGHEPSDLAWSIQTCIIECVVEATSNGNMEPCLPLEDFIITKDTISTCLERLLKFNTTDIKSVYINTAGMKPDTVKRVIAIICHLQDTQSLQKLCLIDFGHVITNMHPVNKILYNNKKKSLTCLKFVSIPLTTTESCDAVCRALTHVTALGLLGVTLELAFTQILQLSKAVSQAKQLRQLLIDPVNSTSIMLDVSGLTHLHTLMLRRVKILEKQLQQFIQAISNCSFHTLNVELINITIIGNSNVLTDLKHNPNFEVTLCCEMNSLWNVKFHIKQQTTTASDKQK